MKKLDTDFIKVLIETDFFLLSTSKNSKKKKNLRYSNSLLNVPQNNILKNTISLDLLELTKSLKQTIRLLQFLKLNKTNSLQLYTSNKFFLNLLNTLLIEFVNSNTVKISNSLINTDSGDKSSNILFLLEDSINNNERIFKRLFENKIYIVNKINSRVEINNWSTYKIFNDFSDFKKIIFLIVLLRRVL